MGIDDGLIAIGILFTIFVAPFWVIMHYITKWKATKGLSDEEQRMLEELWHDSQRLESRLSAIETILDSEAPKGGGRGHDREHGIGRL